MVIGLLAAFRQDLDGAVFHGVQRRANDFGGVYEPLVGQHRLDHHFGTVAKGLHDRLVFDVGHGLGDLALVAVFILYLGGNGGHHGKTFGGDLIDHQFARLKPVQTAQIVGHQVDGVGLCLGQGFLAFGDGHRNGRGLIIRRTICAHRAFGVHQAVHRNATAFGDLIVVEIMRAGDLHGTRTKVLVRVFIGDDRDQAAVFLGADGDFDQLAHDGGITLVRWVHSHRAVAQHGFGAGGGDGDIVALFLKRDVAVLVLLHIGVGRPTCERVFEVPHVACDLDILYLKVGDRGFKMRIPVHQPLAAVDQTLVVHLNKDLDDGVVEIGRVLVPGAGVALGACHGEGGALEITGGAETLQLFDDGAAGFLFPFPDLLEELGAGEIGAFLAVLGQFTLYHHLGCDACVVGAGLPERVIALHPLPADQDVLQRVVEGMTHVQDAGNVRRGDHDAVGVAALGVCARAEATGLFPGLGEPGFGFGCVKCLVHRHRIVLPAYHLIGLSHTERGGKGKGSLTDLRCDPDRARRAVGARRTTGQC